MLYFGCAEKPFPAGGGRNPAGHREEIGGVGISSTQFEILNSPPGKLRSLAIVVYFHLLLIVAN